MAAKKPATGNTNSVQINVIALVPVEHDGTRYDTGDQFDLPADAVKPLADVNAVKVVGEVAEAAASNAE